VTSPHSPPVAPTPAAGGNWNGKKTTFAEEEGEDCDGTAAAAGAEVAADAEGAATAAAAATELKRRGSSSGGGSKKSSKQENGESKGVKGVQEGGSGTKKVKWVKLAAAELKRVPKRRLKWSTLWAALWEQDTVSGLGCGAKEAKAACWSKISGSSKLEINGKKVQLVERG
jgi:hypothetical protein